MLSNGSRLYIDLDHPEYSTPIAWKAEELVAADAAGAMLLSAMVERVREEYGSLNDLRIYKISIDRAGNSFGCHENYLVTSAVFDALTGLGLSAVRAWLPFLVSRTLFTGAGRVELDYSQQKMWFELSPRAKFIRCVTGLSTTNQRALINTRDRPYADPKLFRRLHVITGEANRSEFSNFLKVGVTQLILTMLNEGRLSCDFTLADPVQAIKQTSTHPFRTIKLQDGRDITPLQIQYEFLKLASEYMEQNQLQSTFGRVVQVWKETLDDLVQQPHFPMRTVRRLDWLIKRRLLMNAMASQAYKWGDPRLAELDDLYHLLGKDDLHHFLLSKGEIETCVPESMLTGAVRRPPSETRASLRASRILERKLDLISGFWEQIIYDDGTLERYPDPRGASIADGEHL
jgi:proteasome accessory factor A